LKIRPNACRHLKKLCKLGLRPKFGLRTKSDLFYQVTLRYIIHDLVVVELFYVEYYRDLEMWVRGHSRSLKVVPFESVGTVSYSPTIVTMAVSLAI